MGNKLVKNKLLIFAKAPIVGEVKTRLQPLLTPQQASDFHRGLVEHCLKKSLVAKNIAIELWVGSEHEWWSELSERYGVEVRYQKGADLGERMLRAFESALSDANNVVIIGTDCPFIDAQYIEVAFTKFGQSELVLGPAEDGGYVLIGLKHPHKELFENIDWGTESVFSQTLKRVDSLGLSLFNLPVLMDIDRPSDFKKLAEVNPKLTLLH